MASKPKRGNSDVVDIAIVGAGVSGLYAAWRLLSSGNSIGTVSLYESQDEIGGRIRSLPVPGLPYIAELGGMRFRKSHHLLSWVVERLALPTGAFEFPMRSALIRGRSLTQQMLQKGTCEMCNASMPFQLGSRAVAVGPAKLLLAAIHKILADLEFGDFAREAATGFGVQLADIQRVQNVLRSDSTDGVYPLIFTARQWRFIQEHATLAGDPLHHLGFWSLIAQQLQAEEFDFVRNLLGYETIVSNWNAAEALLWFVSDFADESFRYITTGFSSVPIALRDEVTRLGARINFNTTLVRIRMLDQEQDARFGLEFRTSPSGAGYTIPARIVILALPLGALERVKGLEDILWRNRVDPAVLLESVSAQALFKLFLGFTTAWWSDGKRKSERAVTDSPLRQVFYDSATWRTVEGDPEASLLMASYSDAQFVSFWRPTSSERRKQPYYLGDWRTLPVTEQECLWQYGSDDRMVRIALDLLRKLHPGGEIPPPRVALYKDWREAPFYGGWHTWRAGVKGWAVRDAVEMLVPGLHVCGEAFSTDQGWVEGALKSTERVLQRLGIEAPSGLNPIPLMAMGYEGLSQYIKY